MRDIQGSRCYNAYKHTISMIFSHGSLPVYILRRFVPVLEIFDAENTEMEAGRILRRIWNSPEGGRVAGGFDLKGILGK